MNELIILILIQGLTKIGIYPEMLFIAILFLAFLFFSISNRVGVYPEMLFIAMLFLAFLVAIFNKYIHGILCPKQKNT